MSNKIVHFSNKVARRAHKMTDQWAMEYWHDFPFGKSPRADEKTYKALWEEAKSIEYPEIDEFEKQSGFEVEKDWYHNLALHTQICVKDSNLVYQHGRVLYSALRTYISALKKQWQDQNIPAGQQMLTIVETGTARGFSSVVMAKAMSDEQAAGKIITFDLLPHNTKMYWNCIDDNEGAKTRSELLSPWADLVDPYIIFMENDSRVGIRRTAFSRINFAFLDGAHTYDDVMLEFDMVQQRQQAGDVIVFDDYNPTLFPGIVKGVDAGCDKWGYTKQVLRSRDDRAYVIATKN